MIKNLLFLLFTLSISKAHSQNEEKWTLLWHDEFDYTGLPNPKYWNYEEGFVRNKEPQYYTKARRENAHVEGGNLIIEARKENFPGTPAAYTSASLNTLDRMSFQSGTRIEVRAKVPKGRGAWPAVWMLGEDRQRVKWPFCGEIDIMEFVGRDSTQVYGTVHYADDNGQYDHQGKKPVVGTPYDGYHIYAIDWHRDNITFYYDDLPYFVFDLTKTQKATQNIFNKKFYLLLNLALGRNGTLGGPLDDAILPCRYYIDYVRVYREKHAQ